MADQGGDAQCRGRQSDAAWSAGDPGRHLHRLSAGRLLGCVGRRLGVYPAEFPDRRCARCALCAFWRAVLDDRSLLRREPGRHRPDSSFLLSPGQARHGGLAAMGYCSRLLCRDDLAPGRGRDPLHHFRDCRHPVLRPAAARPQAAAWGGDGARAARHRHEGGKLRHSRQIARLLSQSRKPHFRQRSRDSALSRKRAGATDRLAQRTRVSGGGGGRHDQSRSRRHHRHLCRLSRGRVLGLARLDRRYISSFVPADPDCRSDPGPASRQSEYRRICKGRLCRRHRHDPRRVRSARQDRDRRLAHRTCGNWQPSGPVPLQGQQPAAYRCDRGHWSDRLPAAAARLGIRQIGRPQRHSMRWLFVFAAALSIGDIVMPRTAAAQNVTTQIDISRMSLGLAPDDFTFWRTGDGDVGVWHVVEDPSASDRQVIAQTSKDPTDYRFPLAVYRPISAKNVDVVLRLKLVGGTVDQAGGIVVRLTTPDDYYVVRANALEDNVRFYRMVKGRREQLDGENIKIAFNEWHTLGLRAENDRFTISFDGRELLSTMDSTFNAPGKVGLWTKADSVTHFDRIAITPLE